MQITMLSTHYISEDSHEVRLCKEKQTYNIAHTAATNAIRDGWAFETDPKSYNQYLREMLAELRAARQRRKSA